jgi:hypothetical protein
MRDDPRLVPLAWGLMVLIAVVILTLQDAPQPVVLALIASLPRPYASGDPPPPRATDPTP